MAAKLRLTPDAELVTEVAIRIRINMIRQDGPVTPKDAKRIEALKARLPNAAGEAVKPAVDAALLVSSNCLEWGDRMAYAK